MGLVLLVLAYGMGMVWFLYLADRVAIADHTVLVLDLKGALVEESAGGLRDKVLGELQGESTDSVRLRDLQRALALAAKDPRIDRVLLKLDGFKGGGMASLREAAGAIEMFKTSGKPVMAWSAAYDQRQYYLAAHASQVAVHPMGTVFIEGFGRQRNYYKEALDKLGIEANLIRVGQYKSAGEPFVLSQPSAQALKAEAHVYDALWKLYTQGIEQARKLPPGSVVQHIDSLPGALQAVQGNAGQLVKDWKWVDQLQTFESLRQTLMDTVGKDEDGKTFRQVGFKEYLRTQYKPVKGEHIAVIVAQGEIGNGRAPAGKIGGLSTSDLIRTATEDEDVKAIVLRVNSPGGSAFASELIRDQLRMARDKGKPVLVSMGDVAASGGYWIAMSADQVWADASTITGSIGVFAMLPTGEGLMRKLGVNTGGYRTTWLAGAYDPRKALDPRVQALVQSSVEHIYADFIGKAAQARKLDVAQVDALAQGRIWTGAQAQAHGLVDRVGSFNDAVEAARELVGKSAGANSPLPIRYWGPQVSKLQSWVQRYWVQAAAHLGWNVGPSEFAPITGLPGAVNAAVAEDFIWLKALLDQAQPFAAAAHCLCQITP
ncbi:signal peptide peptidase SppA [Limnohabitans planktonicus]|uniref:Signal peptide peptidase SppA n=1 Tax=Limnohabitans planktonicus II-D5 TaxID=1293045 RepID=A0A2T7UB53_9BURK|nr:signal peptide peptidase SppA [Limnohabitans planktonicus]PVE41940.1 signal peptide peptidase SppA [Limnohabitans planktonicus II-D5]|eukprot:gene24467-30819_t